MKKLLFSAAVIALAATGASAQLTVFKNGQTRFGKVPSGLLLSPQKSPDGPISGGGTINNPNDPDYIPGDTLASAIFYGRSVQNQSYIAFDHNKKVYVGAMPLIGTSTSNWSLVLNGYDGLKATCQKGTIFSCGALSTKIAPFFFYTNVNAPAFITSSDSRLKSNVEGLENASGLLSRLNPVSYNLTVRDSNGGGEATKASAANAENFDDRVHYGFIAQEVREIFPNLVVEDEDGMLGIDYTGFIPVMVDAIKDLQATVAEQQAEIARLNGAPQKKNAAASADGLESEIATAYLAQNRPNPFRESTEIRCSLPENTSEAFICIYDMQGKQLRRIAVAERGETSVTIEGSSLQPGMYIYALIADGSEIGSKRMIITD